MKINRKTLKSWMIKIVVILIVITMVLTGFVTILWK